MKTIAIIFTGWTAVAIVLSASSATAEPPSGTAVWLGMAAVGQANPSPQAGPTERRQKADELLHRAHEAMAQNDLAAADSLIRQAEALDPQYGPLHLGDTPKKARRDLDRLRSAAGKSPTRPSQIFSPLTTARRRPHRPIRSRADRADP